MRLGPRERRCDPPEVAEGGHVRRAVEELAHPGAAPDPVPGREGVQEPLAQEVGPDRGADLDLLPAGVGPLERVLQVLDEVRECDPEQVLHEVAGELQSLVRVVVLVVLLPFAEMEFEDGPRDPTEEDGLLDPVLPRVAEVGEQGAVEDRFDLFRPVFLRLPRREFLLEVVHRVVAGEDPTRRVQLLVLALLDVRVHDVRHLRNGDDGVVDLLVLLRAEGFHQDDERDLAGGGRDGHDEHPVLFISTRVRARYPSRWENTFATGTRRPYRSLYSTRTRFGARSSSEIRARSVPPMMK